VTQLGPRQLAGARAFADPGRLGPRQLAKGHFPNEDAARKLIYLAVTNAVPAWTTTRNWTVALLAFKIHLGDRLPDAT
jgi:transposase-like protein